VGPGVVARGAGIARYPPGMSQHGETPDPELSQPPLSTPLQSTGWPPAPVADELAHLSLRSIAVAAGRPAGPGTPLNEPIVLASNVRESDAYVRTHGTATWVAFERALGAIERGHALSFASGMAAAAALLYAYRPKVIVLPKVSYMGVRVLLADTAADGHVECRHVDGSDTHELLAAAEGADLVWLETPSNPTLDVTDLATVCGALKARGIPTVVDSTFATPLGQQPLVLGASAVLHAATKFIGGHSDLLLGAVVTADSGLYEKLFRARTYAGATPGALEVFLALRGLRTLPLRYDAASRTAEVLAERLRSHHAVASVRQIGPMMAVVVKGGASVADAVCARARLMVAATSLGGVETSLERRQKYAGDSHVDPGLLRVSVGIEDVEDLWADWQTALGA
jgi:cystathionine gamma-synthase